MSRLSPDLVLKRLPDIEVRINSDNNIQVVADDTVYYIGQHGLAVLDAFYQPVRVSQALERLRATIASVQDWMALTTTILQLYDAGILQDENQRKRELKTSKKGFGGLGIHRNMLNDRARTSALLTGISEVVRPGDIVVDIGTGTGVLAVAAARAGARHVYAVEASAIGEVAQAVFEVNGLSERITLVRGWSTHIDLPERADVLVSEIIGNDPLGENVLEVTRDAHRRLLKPGAHLVPSKVRILGLPVTIPEAELFKRVLTTDNLKSWRSWYGIDLSPMARVKQEGPPSFNILPHTARDWDTLSEPILLAQVDLGKVDRLMVDSTVTVEAVRPGTLNGLLVYFELDLGPGTTLSTHPARADEDNSWFCKVWGVEPMSLRTNDPFNVTYKYRATGKSHAVAVASASS